MVAWYALENDVLEKIKYEGNIKNFISNNIRGMMLFTRKVENIDIDK